MLDNSYLAQIEVQRTLIISEFWIVRTENSNFERTLEYIPLMISELGLDFLLFWTMIERIQITVPEVPTTALMTSMTIRTIWLKGYLSFSFLKKIPEIFFYKNWNFESADTLVFRVHTRKNYSVFHNSIAPPPNFLEIIIIIKILSHPCYPINV